MHSEKVGGLFNLFSTRVGIHTPDNWDLTNGIFPNKTPDSKIVGGGLSDPPISPPKKCCLATCHGIPTIISTDLLEAKVEGKLCWKRLSRERR